MHICRLQGFFLEILVYIKRNGEELPRMSPGVGCDSTAQGKDNIYKLLIIFISY